MDGEEEAEINGCTMLYSAHEMAIESGVVNAVTVITVFAADCFGRKISSPRAVHAISCRG